MADKIKPCISFDVQKESVDFSEYSDSVQQIFSSSCQKNENEVNTDFQRQYSGTKDLFRKNWSFWILFTLTIFISIIGCISIVQYYQTTEKKFEQIEGYLKFLKTNIVEEFGNKENQTQITYDTAIMKDQVEQVLNSITNNEKTLENLRNEANNSAQGLQEYIEILSLKLEQNSEDIRKETDKNAIVLRNISRAINENMRQSEKQSKELANLYDLVFVDSDAIALDCGGIINLQASVSATATIAFNTNSSGRCLWTIQSAASAVRSKLTVNLKGNSIGIPGAGFEIYAFQWNRNILTSTKLENQKYYKFNSEALFISFTAGNSILDTGFILKISVVQAISYHFGNNIHYNFTPGSMTIGSHRDHEVDTIVINSNQGITFSVDKINTEECCDWLQVYEIKDNGGFTLHPRLSGNNASTPLRFFTFNPILAVFTTDGSAIREGFQISWV